MIHYHKRRQHLIQ